MSDLFGKFRISHRLYAGFALLILLLAGAVGTTLWQVSSIGVRSEVISNLRVPTALASEELSGNLNAASAGLRGFLLTGSEKMRADFDVEIVERDDAVEAVRAEEVGDRFDERLAVEKAPDREDIVE